MKDEDKSKVQLIDELRHLRREAASWDQTKGDRKRSLEQFTGLISGFLSLGVDPLENVTRLTAVCGELLHGTCALYNRLEEGMLCTVGRWNVPPDYNPIDAPDGHICFDVISKGMDETTVIRGLHQTRYAETDPNVKKYKLQTYIGHPVKFGEAYIGSLCVVYAEDVAPSENDRLLIRAIAAAIAIEEQRKKAESALSKQVQFLQTLVEAIPDPIFYKGVDGKYLGCNNAFTKWVGLPKEKVIGRKVHEVATEEFADVCEKQDMRLFAHPGSSVRESSFLHPDGSHRSTSVNKSTFANADGSVGGLIGVISDVSDLKRAEEALRLEREQLLSIFDSVDEVISVIDAETYELLYVNKFVRDRYGQDLLGGLCYKELHGLSRPCRHCTKGIVSRLDGKPYQWDYHNPTINRDYLATDRIIKWTDGRDAKFHLGIDVTERKKAEEALRESEEKFSTAFRSAPNPMMISSFEDGTLIEVNDEFVATYGYERAEVLGKTALQLGIWKDADERSSWLQQIKSEGYVKNHDLSFSTKDRRLRQGLHSTVIIQLQGKPFLMSTFNDITDRKKAEQSLRESEARFRFLSENTFEAIFLSEKGICTGQNLAAEKMFGYSIQEAVGRPGTDWIAPEHREIVRKNIVLDHAPPYEVLALRKDGTTFPCEIQAKMISDDERRIRVTALRDITERKKAEQALRDSEERRRLAWETIPDALSITRMDDGTYVDVNNGFTVVSGYSRGEVLGKSSLDIPTWPDLAARGLFVSCLARDGHVKNVEAKLRRKDGSYRTFSISAAQLTLNGEPHILAVARDVEDHYQTAQALRASEEKYRNIFENAVEGIFQTTPDGGLIGANPALAKMFGYGSPEEMIKDVTNLALQIYGRPEDRHDFVSRVEESGQLMNYEVEHRHKEGTTIWVSVNAHSVRDEIGRVLYYEGTIKDITDRKKAEEAQAKSEALLKAILDASPVGIALAKNRRLEWANRTLYDLFGYEPDEIQEAHVRQFVMSDDDYQRVGDTLYAGHKKGEVRETDVLFRRRNGMTFHCVLRVTVIDDDPDNLTAIALFWDITERKMSEESIRVRLNLLEFAASHSLEELLQKTLDEIGRLTDSRIGFYHFVESDQKTLSLQAWSTPTVGEFCTAKGNGLHYPIDQAGVWVDCIYERKPVIHNDYSSLSHRKGMPEGHATVTRELVVPITRSDRIVAVLGIGNKPTDYTEKDVEICSYLADVAWEIAEHKRAEEALKESEQRYKSLFEESRDGVYCVLRDGEMTDANTSLCELFGYTKEEMIGKNVHEFYLHAADRPRFQREIEKKGFVKDYAVRFRKRDGTSMDCLLTASIVSDMDGNILGYRGFVRDVTDRKRLRHQLLQAQKMEAVGTLAGGIAHDFNNLLTIVMGFSELLLAEKDQADPEYADLQKICDASKSGADLVQRLLMFSRKSDPKPVPMNLNRQILGVGKLLRRTIPKMVEIHLDLSPDMADIHADPSQMEQVLLNLAVNARDAMPDGGLLTVSTQTVTLDEEYCRLHVFGATPGEYVLLKVSDTGHGMDRETLEHIFEPFFTTKEKGRGTGLGLAMVYGIVTQHKGHITVNSQVGKGATFTLYLPAMSAEAEPEVDTGAEIPAFGTEAILLVDDEEFVRELGARILTKHGYTVLQARDGKTALRLFKRERSRISLVILDLIMPKMGGPECLKELLKIDPQVNVLVASGYSAEESVKMMIQFGAKGFVTKPFKMKELLRDVRKMLDKG